MPYENEHSCRLELPGKYPNMARKNNEQQHDGKRIDVIYGIISPKKSEIQALRYPKGTWSAAEAKAHCSGRGGILFEPATKGASIMESAALTFYEGGLPITATSIAMGENDTPIQRFKKDMISLGLYKHPIKNWTMDVTTERLHRWLAAFQKMRENGVDIEVPLDHSRSAEANLGYVIDAFIEPNEQGVETLWGILEIRGQDAIETTKRNRNVSVLIDPDYVDGSGHSYGEAITHCSIVQQPIVSGQEDFEAIAASNIPVYVFSANLRGDKMLDEAMVTKIRELLGAGDDLTAENALARIGERLTKFDTDLKAEQKKIVELEGKLSESEKNKSASQETELDPNLVEQMATTAGEKLQLLVDKGHITPKVREKLAAALIGEQSKRNVKALSIGSEGSSSLVSAIVDALKENNLVELGEKTGVQVVDLKRSLSTGDEDDEKKEYDPDVKDEMVAMAGGAAKT